KRAPKINIGSSIIFAARGNPTSTAGLSCGETLLRRRRMRILAVMFGAAAVLAVAAPVAADPATGRLQLAQTQDSGSQSSTGAKQRGSSGMKQQGSSGTNQQGSAGQRQSGTAAKGTSSGGKAAMGTETGSTSPTSVRERSRGARMAVHSGSRTAIGVRHPRGREGGIIPPQEATRYGHPGASTTAGREETFLRPHA